MNAVTWWACVLPEVFSEILLLLIMYCFKETRQWWQPKCSIPGCKIHKPVVAITMAASITGLCWIISSGAGLGMFVATCGLYCCYILLTGSLSPWKIASQSALCHPFKLIFDISAVKRWVMPDFSEAYPAILLACGIIMLVVVFWENRNSLLAIFSKLLFRKTKLCQTFWDKLAFRKLSVG